MSVRIESRGIAQRCSICHDALEHEAWRADDVVVCPRCATAHHDTCRDELGRCPTLGCDLAGQLRITPRDPERLPFETHALLSLVTALLASIAAVATRSGLVALLAIVFQLGAPLVWCRSLRSTETIVVELVVGSLAAAALLVPIALLAWLAPTWIAASGITMIATTFFVLLPAGAAWQGQQ